MDCKFVRLYLELYGHKVSRANENISPGKTYQYDPNTVQLHKVPIDTAGVCLKQAGYQPNHIQPGVADRRVQHTPCRLHHTFLRKKKFPIKRLPDTIPLGKQTERDRVCANNETPGQLTL